MTPRDIFGVLIRFVGLVLILYGIRALVVFLALPSGVDAADGGSGVRLASLALVLLALVIGAYLLGGAPSVMRYSYPGSPGSPS